MLLCNDLGTKRDPTNPGAVVKSNGHGSISVKEAVRVAKSNNFMGLVCNSRLLVCTTLLFRLGKLDSMIDNHSLHLSIHPYTRWLSVFECLLTPFLTSVLEHGARSH